MEETLTKETALTGVAWECVTRARALANAQGRLIQDMIFDLDNEGPEQAANNHTANMEDVGTLSEMMVDYLGAADKCFNALDKLDDDEMDDSDDDSEAGGGEDEAF